MTASVSNWRLRAALPLVALAAAGAIPTSASAGVALSTSGWEWSDPSPQGYTLNDIQFAGPRGYAVGAGGTALRTDDGGNTWSGLFTGTSTTANSVDVINPDAIAIATGNSGNCAVRVSDNGGGTFKNIPIGENDNDCGDTGFTSFDFVSPTTGYVLRGDGSVLATTNGESVGVRSKLDGATSIRFKDDQNGFATAGGKIFKTTDGATNWAPIHDAGGQLSQIRLIGANTIVAWGQNRLVRSTDGGATFTPGTIAGNPLRMSWSDELHYAFVSENKLILSDDGGATTREVTLGNKDVIAAGFVDTNRLVAVGTGGATYVSTDAGTNFTRQSSDRIAGGINYIAQSAGGPIGVGTGNTIARVENGKWVQRASSVSTPVIDADFSSPTKGYILHGGSVLRRTIDNGATWSPVDAGAPSAVDFLSTPDDNTVLLFGGFGILRATNNGAFDPVDDKLVRKLKPLGARSEGARVTVWTAKSKAKPIISANGGESWSAVALPKGVKRTRVIKPLPGKGLLLEADGRLFRSAADSGKKWTEITAAGSRADASGAEIAVASNTEYWAPVDSSDWPVPVVLHTTDAGKTWQPQAIGATGTSVKSLVAAGPKTAFALSTSSTPGQNAIFATTTGGSRGAGTTLSLDRTPAKLKRSAGKIQIKGLLTGGKGDEAVHVAIRKEDSATWTTSNVIVGANAGGSFTATIKASKGKYVVVAQWAGDSGRAGSGTTAKALTITK